MKKSEADNGIRVELYGIARQKAGTAQVWIPAQDPMTLEVLWQCLLELHPQLGVVNAPPSAVYRMNLNGDQFVDDPQLAIHVGQCVLVMSADAGG